MGNPLNARLSRIEERLPIPQRFAKIARLVASQEEEDAVYDLARQQGLDVGPGSKDVVVIRLVAATWPDGRHEGSCS